MQEIKASNASPAKSSGLNVKTYYVEGSNAYQPEEYDRIKRERHREKMRVDARTKKNRSRARALNAKAVASLTVALVVVCLSLGSYIYVSAEVSSKQDKIAALESSLMDIQEENNAKEDEIELSTDLTKIKQRAIDDLDMQYPKSGQIIYYNVDSDDYMEQYEDIP